MSWYSKCFLWHECRRSTFNTYGFIAILLYSCYACQHRWCKQDQILKTKIKTKTTGSKQRHLADLTFKYRWTPLLISAVVMFQAQNRETINSTWKSAVSFKIIMTTSVTRPCFSTQHHTCKIKTKTAVCKTKTKNDFWSETGLVQRQQTRTGGVLGAVPSAAV